MPEKMSILNLPGASQIQQNKAALSQDESVPQGGRKFISDEERIEQ